MSALSGCIRFPIGFADGPLQQSSVCRGESVAELDGLSAAICGRPIWRPSDPRIQQAASESQRLLELYRSMGLNLFNGLYGSFAFVLIDARAQRALLAVDRFGIERITWSMGQAGLQFSSSAHAVACVDGRSPRIRLQALFSYLFFHMVPSPETIFEGVSKLPPANLLLLERGQITQKCYWQPRFHSVPGASFETLRRDLHTSLEHAVQAQQPDSASGAFLSGGLDSSTVAGYLQKVSTGQAKTFSIGFGIGDYDELHFARIANRHFGCQGHEYQVRPDDIVDMFPSIARQYDEPFGNASALPTYCCARLARDHGVTHLLAGDGGDEIFAGNTRYAEQRIYERYEWLPRMFRTQLLEPALGALPGAFAVGVFRKARNYVALANTPLPDRLENWNFLLRLGFDAVFDREFLNAIDTNLPLHHMRTVYTSLQDAPQIGRMLHYDWRFTLADNDLRKVGTMCALAGVRVSYPMLHPDVIDVSLRVPAGMMMPGMQLRKFYKQAVEGFLPKEIINKKKHGFGLPFGLWLESSQRLTDLVNSNLESLRASRVVRADFIDRLRRLHGEDARYYGVMVWTLAMLGQWLREHELSI